MHSQFIESDAVNWDTKRQHDLIIAKDANTNRSSVNSAVGLKK